MVKLTTVAELPLKSSNGSSTIHVGLLLIQKYWVNECISGVALFHAMIQGSSLTKALSSSIYRGASPLQPDCRKVKTASTSKQRRCYVWAGRRHITLTYIPYARTLSHLRSFITKKVTKCLHPHVLTEF